MCLVNSHCINNCLVVQRFVILSSLIPILLFTLMSRREYRNETVCITLMPLLQLHVIHTKYGLFNVGQMAELRV